MKLVAQSNEIIVAFDFLLIINRTQTKLTSPISTTITITMKLILPIAIIASALLNLGNNAEVSICF